MKIHHYNPETLEYLGEGQADESPLEPGVFLIPAHATATAPPAAVAGKVRAFEAGAWVQRDPPAVPGEPLPTAEEVAAREAMEKKAREQAIALDALPDLLAYIAAKADAPAAIKTKGAELATEKAKAK